MKNGMGMEMGNRGGMAEKEKRNKEERVQRERYRLKVRQK